MDIASFNIVDIGIIVLVILSALIGLVRGFVREAISLTTWLAAAVLAFMFYKQLSELIPLQIEQTIVKDIMAGVLIFVLVLIAGSVINFFFSRLMSMMGLGALDRILGSAFGILRGILVLALLVMLLSLVSNNITDMDIWKSSQLIPKLEEVADWIRSVVPPDAADQIADILQRFGLEADKTGTTTQVQDGSGTSN